MSSTQGNVSDAADTHAVEIRLSGVKSEADARKFLKVMLGAEFERLAPHLTFTHGSDGSIVAGWRTCCYGIGTSDPWWGSCSDNATICLRSGSGCPA
jgi:hypothetical protein